jgi:serine/threonine protein kinase/formylglycine-generating enzyme required for sulfatase activity
VDDTLKTVPSLPIFVDEAAAATPKHIGRYKVEKVLGEGGFGLVYLAHDNQLQRSVAVKVPHRRLVFRSEDAESYLTEARTVANLDHPNIVPVYDVGNNEEYPVFIVSKYIEGNTLAQRIKENPPSVAETAELVATVAETLHYAHKQGLVHRDIKPGNILLDASGKPYVADFGLALRETDVGRGPCFAGTPAYMSPEQARREGHRVDGRSDIFSLGVVFYELLTGRRPFKADSIEELLEQITSMEARPPRQWEDTIPKELERICLKALSKRASERPTTAKDMADDLRHFLAAASVEEKSRQTGRVSHETELATPMPSPVLTPSDQQPVKIVPKGLRSFDAQDADFFLELLPGPRDRDGLPDSLRFWKTRIEEKDPDNTFSVSLIYGPSGCGKSSLVKAGLLPRLAKAVTAVYIEATADETEARLLKGLRRQVPDLTSNLSLIESLAELRRGRFLASGQKVLLVLDQFEQWLHAKRNEEKTELVQALRQCDGSRVQCIVMVRDDFWMAATRFMRALEFRLLEGQNSAAVDLFPTRHAEKVLAAFAQAFGALPGNRSEWGKEQKTFLEQAVSGLAQEGKVICVRLALFAEMMKGKAWTPATLKEVGGTEGIGVTFLEETFSAATAPPEHRYHQNAARAVLKALLPEAGTDIKGHMRSHAELLAASGYANRPKDFDDLLRILDSELRLITPTDPEGKEDAEPSTMQAGVKYYQLTHDYLVPSLRDWLTRKQKETRQGRAELLLADRAAVWNVRPENRQLPSLLQWLQIRWLTQKENWTPPQRKMMRRAHWHHALRGLALAVVLMVLVAAAVLIRSGVVEQNNATNAEGLVHRLLDADIGQVPGIVSEIEPYRQRADPLLRAENNRAADNSREKLHISLALLPVDPGQVDYLYGRLLDAAPNEVPVIRDALEPHKDKLLDKLWDVAEAPEKSKESQRLRAAAALALYDSDNERWDKAGALVVNNLVLENPIFLGHWSEALLPVKNRLLPQLSEIFRNHQAERTTERSLATNILADYATDQPKVLADLLMEADAKQFTVIYPKFKEQCEQGLPVLICEINKKLSSELPSSDEKRETLAKRQANAAVALLRMGRTEQAWRLLKHGPDPRVRSYLIHFISPLGVDPRTIVKRLDEEQDVSIRRALLLSLGEYNLDQLTAVDREPLLVKVWQLYHHSPDAGLHGAAEWLLRQWQQDKRLKEMNEQWAKDRQLRETRLATITQQVVKDQGKATPQWYVNGQGQTMVVLPGLVEFVMGSPRTEIDRERGPEGTIEQQHKKRIGHSFAIAAREVTVGQFLRFRMDHDYFKAYSPTLDCPVNMVAWYDAAAYCNWLCKKEGIPETQWCYLRSESDKHGEGMKMAPDYLRRTGYRLPSEAEWEYACRAKAVTSRYYGETEELLSKYGWYTTTSKDRGLLPGLPGVLRVRGNCLKPNDFGLFDMLGNVTEWCQDSWKEYPSGEESKTSEDNEDKQDLTETRLRILRGGSFFFQPWIVRCSHRNRQVPTSRGQIVGFRVARTFH